MAKIPGWAFLGVGIMVSVYSKVIESKAEGGNAAMSLFFWIGMLLVVIGAFKVGVRFITGEKPGARTAPAETRSAMPDQGPRAALPGGAVRCVRCNAKLHPQSRYCNWCGAKV